MGEPLSQSAAPAAALDSLVDDYSRQSVPDSATVGGFRIGLILLGAAIALPGFVLGSQLGAGLGFTNMIAACFVGGAILVLIAVLSSIAGARTRLSTYMLILAAFGKSGGKLANAVIGLSLLGWFGVIAMMFGRSATQVSGGDGTSAVLLWAAGGSLVMLASAIVGFRALDRLSAVLTPVKATLLVVTAAAALRQFGGAALTGNEATPPMSLGTGITLVVGALVIGAAVQPDLSRFARTPLSAALASGLVFGLGFPAVLILAGVPSIIMHQSDIVAIMVALGLGLPAMMTVLLAAWTNNTYNLYASSLILKTILARQPRWRLTLAVGAIGTALGLLGIAEQIIPYLVVLSVVMPPIAGIYLANYYVSRICHDRLDCTAAWSAAAAAAWLLAAGLAALESWFGFAVAGVPALDSLFLAALVYVALRRLEKR